MVITSASANPATDSQTIVATYSFVAAGSGVYTVTLRANEVADTDDPANFAFGSELGTFLGCRGACCPHSGAACFDGVLQADCDAVGGDFTFDSTCDATACGACCGGVSSVCRGSNEVACVADNGCFSPGDKCFESCPATGDRYLFGITGYNNAQTLLYVIDTETGEHVLIGDTGVSGGTALAMDHENGVLYVANSANLYLSLIHI